MFIADSHSHSLCSTDARFTMAEMAEAAVDKGLSILTITDHVDLDHFEDGKFNAYCFEIWPDMQEDFYEACTQYGDKIDLRIGIELGEANHHPEFAKHIYRASGLDFVIGSIHNIRDTPDFYFYEYKSLNECVMLLDKYLHEHIELASMPEIDVIAHIGYTRRYMRKAGYDLALDNQVDILTEIYKTAISNGIGIELNTSGIRQGLDSPIPGFEQIKLYRDCGGEIITVGSDAHFPHDVGSDIEDCYELLRQAGFKYVTVFKYRRPEFYKL